MTKPIVHYYGSPRFFEYEDDNGESKFFARVYALNHPIWHKGEVRTSLLVSERGDEGFETLNTVYRRISEDR